jgi:hypothetical protein
MNFVRQSVLLKCVEELRACFSGMRIRLDVREVREGKGREEVEDIS